ncbi:MAG: hypothetical protein WCA46_12245 [Actinocatenispora sp.]
MSGHAWAEVAGAIGLSVLTTTVLTVTIWQLAATWRAKILLARENEYRKLAQTSLLVQEATERRLAEIDERLARTQSRVETVERILREVE